MKMVVLWDVALCSLVEVYRLFRGTCCLHHLGDSLNSHLHTSSIVFHKAITLMMEAINTSETSVNFYQITRRNNPEEVIFVRFVA
jgi:hypothetical protein